VELVQGLSPVMTGSPSPSQADTGTHWIYASRSAQHLRHTASILNCYTREMIH